MKSVQSTSYQPNNPTSDTIQALLESHVFIWPDLLRALIVGAIYPSIHLPSPIRDRVAGAAIQAETTSFPSPQTPPPAPPEEYRGLLFVNNVTNIKSPSTAVPRQSPENKHRQQ